MQDNKMPKVQVRNLTKKFGDLLVLNDISFDVRSGESVSYTHLTLPTTR